MTPSGSYAQLPQGGAPWAASKRPLPSSLRQDCVGWLDDDGALLPDPEGLPYFREFGPWRPAVAAPAQMLVEMYDGSQYEVRRVRAIGTATDDPGLIINVERVR